jgi:hypothetical protein
MQRKIIRAKHNKKRNTVFLYEALMKEMTACILRKDEMKKATIVSLFKEYFNKDSILKQEMELYEGILNSHNLPKDVANKVIEESKKQYAILDKEHIFNEQTKLINSINRRISPNVFSNFVSNYKSLATIAQIFNASVPVKDRVILENLLVEKMSSKTAPLIKEEMKPLDDLVFKTFIKKFNEKYATNLLKEQKELLIQYIMSFSDNNASLKFFLNEELERIKSVIVESAKKSEIKDDKQMLEMVQKLGTKLESYKYKKFNKDMLSELLKIQEFAKEVNTSG